MVDSLLFLAVIAYFLDFAIILNHSIVHSINDSFVPYHFKFLKSSVALRWDLRPNMTHLNASMFDHWEDDRRFG